MDVAYLDGWSSQRREDDHSKDLEDVITVTSWDTKCPMLDVAVTKGKGMGKRGER